MFELQTEWGWQIGLYLFLGGLAAGTFIAAAFLHFTSSRKLGNQSVLCISAWAATAFLGVGLLLLLSDLTQPMRGLMLWQSFSNISSWMMIGAWIVLVATIVFGLTALLLTVSVIKGRSAAAKTEKDDAAAQGVAVKPTAAQGVNLLFAIGALLGLGVAIYTGVLLMQAPGIPFWGSALLPCLFTVSALGTGIALVEILVAVFGGKDSEVRHQAGKHFKVMVLVLAAIEAIVLFAYISTMLGSEDTATSANLLLSGDLAPVFWALVVVCALSIPIIAALGGMFIKGRAGEAIAIIGALCALTGGCALRFVVLMAGAHVDPVFNSVTKLIS